jgi:hypothetical protein
LPGYWKKGVARFIGAGAVMQGNKADSSGLMDTLGRLGSDLETLASSTESEFLSIGERLHSFCHRAAETAKLSQAAARLMSGAEVTDVIERFRDVVATMKRLERESRENVETLLRFSEILVGLFRQLSDFPKTVRVLRILCVSTKIEAARLGNDDIGFIDLANEVGQLAVEIEDRCSHLVERSKRLSEAIQKVLARVRDLETRQNAQARLILDRTLASLDAITEKHASASAGVKHLATRYEVISRNIGRIVTSMQFHDITRQRIEHAKAALDGIVGPGPEVKTGEGPHHGQRRLPGGVQGFADEALQSSGTAPRGPCPRADAGPRVRFRVPGAAAGWVRRVGTCLGRPWRRRRPEGTAEELHLAGNICELQAAQLRHAGIELVSAVETIIGSLREVSNLVVEMAHETQTLVGAADETGRSSLAEVEAGIASILSAHSAYAAANGELSMVMRSVGEALGEMTAYTGDIEGIGAKIKLIALNSIVKASHIGAGGATLSVLAEATHQLSVETRFATESVSGALQSIVSASRSPEAQGTAGRDDSDSGMGRLRESLTSLPDTLRQVNEGMVALLTRMHEEGRGLSAEILEVVDGIKVHRRINGVISKVVAELGDIVLLAAAQDPDSDAADPEERLRVLEASYTMEGEREVHQSMMAARTAAEMPTPELPAPSVGQAVGSDPEPDAANGANQEDLGDNVEFF